MKQSVSVRYLKVSLSALLVIWSCTSDALGAGERVIRVVDQGIRLGETGTVVVEMDANGDENAIGFSLEFDPDRLTYQSATGGGGAALSINSLQASSGRVGVLMGFLPPQVFPQGRLELLSVTFSAGTTPGDVTISFGDIPIYRDVSDATSSSLSTAFSAGKVTAMATPVADLQTVVTDEDIAKDITLTGSRTGTGMLDFSIVASPTLGILSGTPPNLIYAPHANVNGADSFTFKMNDGLGDSDVATVSLTISPVNDAPVADAQTVTTDEDTAKTITLTGSDIEDSPLTQTVVANPILGTLTGTPPTLVYTPNANVNGTDSFAFIVNDGSSDSALATVSLQIAPLNDAPTLNLVADQTVTEDSGELGVALSGISAGPENEVQVIAVTASSNNEMVIGAPVVEYTSPSSTALLTMTPVTDSNGEATITVTLQDNGGAANDGIDTLTRSFKVDVTGVNDPPTISAIEDQTVSEDSSSPEIAFTVGDIETEVALLTVSADSSDPTLIGTSGIQLGGAEGDRTVKLTPLANQAGTAEITLTVRDAEGGEASRTFLLVVGAVNDLPVISEISGQVIDEDNATGTILFTVQDQETPLELLALTASSSDQALVADTDIVLGGTEANRTVQITPAANAFGSVTITIQAIDADAGATELSFAVTVVGINDAPVVGSLANQTIEEDAGLQTVHLTGINPGPDNENVQTVTLTATSSNPSLIADPTIEYTGPNDTGTLTYSPVENENGTVTLTVLLQDDGGTENGGVDSSLLTFDVTVNAVNDPPTLAAISSQTVNEESLLTVTPIATNVESDTQTLTFSLDPGAPEGASIDPVNGVVSWTPGEPDGPGSVELTVRVTDDGDPVLDATQSFTVTINEINVGPLVSSISSQTVAEGSNLSFSVSASDDDIPSNSLDFSLGAAPPGASISSGGSFSWTPGEGDGPGSYSITVSVSDGVSTAAGSFSVNVTEENSSPSISPISDLSVDEGNFVSVTASASDPDLPNQTLSFSLNAGSPAGASISPSGAFSWTPTEAQGPGTFDVTVRVTDNGPGNFSATENFSITVNELNLPPLLAGLSNQSVPEGEMLTFFAAGVDADQPANNLTFSLLGAPSGATIHPSSGAFSWAPSEAQGPSQNQVAVVVTDDGPGNLSASQSVTLNVFEINAAPVLAPISDQAIKTGETLTVTANGTDPDLPANTLTHSLPFGGPAGASIDSTTGVFTWTPDFTTADTTVGITIQVADDGSPPLSATQSFTIAVTASNTAPSIAAVPDQTVDEGVPLGVSISVTDTDQPAQAVAFSLAQGAPAGASIDPASGQFTWTPTEGDGPGSVSITVLAADNGTPPLNSTQSFTVLINEVNEVPTLDLIADQTVDEETPFSLTVVATDEDLPAQTLTYSLVNGPTGMEIVPATGLITWALTEEQGPSDNPVTVEVIDSGIPAANATQSFTVVVNEVNQVPDLPVIPDETLIVGNTLSISVQATDADLPVNTLSYSLDIGAPNGATIDSASGLLEWTASADQADSTHGITVIVRDNATPVPGEARQSFAVAVASSNTAPELGAIADQTVDEGELLALAIVGIDTDVPAQPLLYELLGDVPAGAQINSATGEFTWNPTEDQGPMTAQISVRVSDSFTPPLSATSTFTVTVNEVNAPPVVESVSSEEVTVNEEAAVSVTVTASDPDLPANVLTYSLGADAPEGSNIDPTSGVFSWTPTKAQGPSNNTITVVVTDNGTPSLNASAVFTVVVNEINSPPTLTAIGDQTVLEGNALTFTVAGSDTDVPAQELRFSLAVGSPDGASIDPTTGVFEWTPNEVQGPFTGTISVRVTDSGTPIGRASRDVNIVVEEANIAPVLWALSDQIVSVGDTLTVESSATDADLPPNVLQFSLSADAPAGAAIDGVTGVFTWTPTVDQVSPGTTITVLVTDDGPGTLSHEQSFSAEVKEGVNLPPALSEITAQTVPENGSTPGIAFTLTDPDTPLENFTFTVSSSNLDLVPEGNIVIGGAGENRTVQVKPLADQSGSATITLAASEPAGGQASTSFDLTVAAVAPAFVRNLPTAVEVLIGGTVDLSVTVSGSQPIAYVWTKDGVELPGETGAVLALSDVTPEDAGSYSVSASNSVASVDSDSTQVNVIVPLRIVDQPTGQTVLEGADVSLGVTAVGEPPLTYQWFVDGVEIPGAAGETLSLGAVEAILAGSYSVVVSNAGGLVTSTAAVLEVIAPIAITLQPESQVAVAGESASLSVEATGSEPTAYQWQFNGLDIGGETQVSLTLSNLAPENSGNYAVVVSNAGGSVTSSAATLAVSIAPTITQQPQGIEVLAGTPVTFEVTVSGTEPLTYQWQFNGAAIDGATGRSLSLSDVTADAAGDYGVTATNAAGSVTSDAATLVVVQPVLITGQPQDQTVTAGAGASFRVTATGAAPLGFQWRLAGVDITGATEPTLSLNNVQAIDAGAYSVVVSNVAGPVSSAAATLTVNVGVVILDQPQSVTVTSGGSASFSVLASGTPAPTFQWRLDGNDIAGATGPSLSVDAVTPANAGSYSVVVQNVAGSVPSADAVLAVIIPPSIETQPQSQTVDLAASVTFSVLAIGDAPLSYQWQKNGGNLAGATGQSFTISNVQAGDSGSYGVVVENPGGAVPSDAASLTVNLPPIESGNSAASAPAPIEDTSGSFDGGSSFSGGGQVARRNAPPAAGEERWFAWRAPANGIVRFDTAGSTFDTVLTIYTGTPEDLTEIASDDDRGGFLTSEVRFNATAGMTYLINVKGFGNAGGQIVVSFDLIATSQKLPVLTSPRSVTAVVGSDVSLTVAATGTDLAFQWLRNGTEIAGETGATLQLSNVQETDALSYTVRVTSTTVVANPVSVESLPTLLHVGTVNSLSADKFLNAPRLTGGVALQSTDQARAIESRSLRAGGAVADGFFGSLAFSTFAATKEPGEPNHCDLVGGASRWITYVAPEEGVVRVTTEGSDFDTVLAIYSGAGTRFKDLVFEACDNNSGADGVTSAANVRVTAGTQYFIAIDGVGGATGTVKLGYEFATGPAIATQPRAASVSVGDHVAFFVQIADPVAGGGTIEPSYQWTKDGFSISGQTANNLTFLSVTLADSGEYAVVVSNFAGSTTSDAVRLDVSLPPAITTQPASQSGNVGDPVSFSAVASGSAPISYQWQLDGTDVAGATAVTYRIASAQTSDEGSYTVVVSNPVGTVTSSVATLSLSQAPTVNTGPADVAVVVGQQATLVVDASGTGTLAHQWRFNGVDIFGATEPSFVLFNVGPEHVGDYTVVVSNEAGSVISDAAQVSVQVPFAFVEQPQSQALAAGSTALFNVRVSGSGPFAYQWRVNDTDLPGATKATLAVANVQALNEGSYTVLVSRDTEQLVSQGAFLSVNSLPVISAQPQGGVFFAGQDVTFSVTAAGSGVLQYQWLLDGEPLVGSTEADLVLTNVGLQSAGNYSVIVRNNTGSAGSELAILTVREIVSQVTRSTGVGVPSAEFSFRVSVPSGNQARVEVSTDMVNWSDLIPVPVTGIQNISDQDSVSLDLRFYRVIVEPVQ